uniref:LDL receptor related protein 2 n=1 Tax=Laticauda laticaudata TaxID=8630 RepID=A0A8C5S259_LATLA
DNKPWLLLLLHSFPLQSQKIYFYNCSSTEFKCASGNQCIRNYYRCDGVFDCSDHSDEAGCRKYKEIHFCIINEWQCPGHSICVNLSKVCDNLADCPNGADESPLCNQETCLDNNAGCTHGCIQGPFGAQCSCPFGYQLANDSKTCEDINECDSPGFCSQHCHNERGSFRCYCDDGYILESNGKTCKVTGEGYPNYKVIGTDINLTLILFRNKRFYKDVNITVFHDFVQVFDSGVTVTESIAVDWIGRNLYWTDYVLETIEVSRLDGSHRTVLVSENVTNPRGLVLDPRTDGHVMFWTDWGQNPRIERASMDGTLRTTIVSNKIYWPNGLSIDYPNKLLYFADAYLDYIDFCDYNGNNRRQVVASDLV